MTGAGAGAMLWGSESKTRGSTRGLSTMDYVNTEATKAGAGAASEWRSGRMSALLFRARAGDVETQFALAQIFESGHGVVIDDATAARWYGEAAEGGHTLAQFYLGQIYANGQGSGQGSGLESGRGAGQRSGLGAGQEAGQRSGLASGEDAGQGRSQGVKKNLVLAYVWWSRAARAGHEGAKAGLRALGEVISEAELKEARGVLGE